VTEESIMPEHDEIRLVSIPSDGEVHLEAELALPDAPLGVVVFAHGSGSTRRSTRNRLVAQSLRSSARVGTLLMDLLSESEQQEDVRTTRFRFDIPLLAGRLLAATSFLRDDPLSGELPIGYFGASTGAAAALVAAADCPKGVAAIVSRGGRPDLAGVNALTLVRAPTLLIVGGEDHLVLEMNREARKLLRSESQLDVIPGASHLFEERGALEQVARRAAIWFMRFLPARTTDRSDHVQP
jgi:pimeloyl-ACP methyl ester carboxylesterase